MKFIKNIPEEDDLLKIKLLNNDWHILKEPSSIKNSILISIPLMLFLAFIYLRLIAYINPNIYVFFDIKRKLFSTLRSIDLPFLISFYIFTLIHEFIHLIFIPNAFKSDKVYIGIKLTYGFVYTSEEIIKSRFIILVIMPFLILSIIAPIVLNMLDLLSINICLLGLFNAIGSSVDLLSIILVVTQVPNKSILRSNGIRTYFKSV